MPLMERFGVATAEEVDIDTLADRLYDGTVTGGGIVALQMIASHNVLREGMAADMLEPAGVYFGTTAGTLFASADGGEHRNVIAEGFPRIQSVEVSVIA